MRSRRRPLQLRTRILVGVLAVMLVALVAFDFAAVTSLRAYLLGRTDSQLRTVLNLARPLPGSAGAPQRFEVLVPRLPATAYVHWSGVPPPVRITPVRARRTIQVPSVLAKYRIAFLAGPASKIRSRVILYAPGLQPLRLANPYAITDGHQAVTVTGPDGSQLRMLAAPTDGGALIATTSLGTVNNTVSQLRLVLILGSVAAALLVGLGIAWIVRRDLRPIETMAAEADRITAGDLTERVSLQDSASEVGRLAEALNGMLGRIEASVREREASQELTRRFFADASHELRTPLASLRANAELYQQGALAEGWQVDEAMRRIALEAQRMSKLVDDMLRLARLDQHPSQQHEVVELSSLLHGCVERAQIADRTRTWHLRIDADPLVTGDEDTLSRAVDNLLANVQAHTPPGTVATVAAARVGSVITVDVSDNGPGVPADQLARIFERFYRPTGPAHRPGSGLGLAIVTAIAIAHNGTARAELNNPHGLRVTLTLPAASLQRMDEPQLADIAS